MKSLKLLPFLLVFTACHNSNKPMPKDFNFKYSFGYFGDNINTFDSTYTTGKNTVGDTTVKVYFTNNEMQRIYGAMVNEDYWNLPETFANKIMIQPCEEFHLEVTAFAKKKKVSCNGETELTSKAKKYFAIQDTIKKILFSKKDVKNLPTDNRMAL